MDPSIGSSNLMPTGFTSFLIFHYISHQVLQHVSSKWKGDIDLLFQSGFQVETIPRVKLTKFQGWVLKLP